MKRSVLLYLIVIVILLISFSFAFYYLVINRDPDKNDAVYERSVTKDIGDEMMSILSNDFILEDRILFDYAKAIFTSMLGEEFVNDSKFTIFDVEEKENIIIINIGPKGMEIDGGDYSIAFNRKNGEILGMWFDE